MIRENYLPKTILSSTFLGFTDGKKKSSVHLEQNHTIGEAVILADYLRDALSADGCAPMRFTGVVPPTEERIVSLQEVRGIAESDFGEEVRQIMYEEMWRRFKDKKEVSLSEAVKMLYKGKRLERIFEDEVRLCVEISC